MKNKVIIGTWPLSGDLGFTDPKIVSETLSACISNGFYSFDTAPNYGNGNAESSLGAISTNSIDLKVHTKFGNNVDGIKDFANDTLISSFIRGSFLSFAILRPPSCYYFIYNFRNQFIYRFRS